MKLEIVIIEDQPAEAERLQNELNSWSSNKNIPISITKFFSGEEYFDTHTPHTAAVYFLDIQLEGMNGLEIAARLRQEDYHGHLIFLTAFREYVFKGYQVHALNYLLKPIQSSALIPCMDEIAETLMDNHYIFRDKQDTIQISYRDILAFSSNHHYVDILTTTGTFSQYTTLKSIIAYLPKEFIQTHRSYIVNMAHIHKLSGSTIVLSNHLTVQIGRQYLNNVRIAFSNYSVRLDSRS